VLDAMITQIEKEQEPREITFETYWGDEVIPDDGSPVFVTEWGGGPMDEDKEALEVNTTRHLNEQS
jgi:hypothetical protein